MSLTALVVELTVSGPRVVSEPRVDQTRPNRLPLANPKRKSDLFWTDYQIFQLVHFQPEFPSL